jgi:glucose-6-phosphate isomerase
MEHLKIEVEKTFGFVSKETVHAYAPAIEKYNKALHEKTGKGNDFLGWVNLPSSITDAELTQLETVGASIREKVDVVVVIGIGGSYLGAKAVNDALSHNFAHLRSGNENPHLLFAGQNIGEDYMSELIEVLDELTYAIVVISKSGTTTEPAVAFRILKDHLESRVGKEEARKLIVAITDKERGALRKLATQEGYATFVIPDDIGGRFSVLTPVGLLPLAAGGFDIRQLVEGAAAMEELTKPGTKFEENPSAIYAATRNALYAQGKKIELLANYNNKLNYFSEWWKQLYGESEGKDSLGIFPASVNFTADLHSMGQYIQEGERHLFETVVSVAKPDRNMAIPFEKENLDGLNFLAYKHIDEVNKMAELGTLLAHVDGGVPNIRIEIPKINEFYIGELIYFFEKACGISGYILGVNPFDQPGVEAYKGNMFALLEKPGYEESTKAVKARIASGK